MTTTKFELTLSRDIETRVVNTKTITTTKNTKMSSSTNKLNGLLPFAALLELGTDHVVEVKLEKPPK